MDKLEVLENALYNIDTAIGRLHTHDDAIKIVLNIAREQIHTVVKEIEKED